MQRMLGCFLWKA
jgi:hypothetical protein